MSALDKARAAWKVVPEWVTKLALACDRDGLTVVAAALGYSKTAVSQTINRRYTGSYDKVEKAVRRALTGDRVGCPALGEISQEQCLEEQIKPFSTGNSLRVRVWRACRGGCGQYRGGGT